MERVRSADVEQTRSVAHALVDEQQAVERAIARHALDLLPQAGAVLTHGATGALATGGVGTAVGAIVAARAVGRAIEAYVIDGSQGWRSTAFELQNAEVPIAVVPAAGVVALLRGIEIAAILVGATAILANGDVIAQLGTATLAGAAAARGVPVFVTAGRSTFGRDCASATLDRYRDILWHPATPTVAGDGSPAEALNRGDRNDLTPARFITAFVTEYGVSRPPYDESLPALAQRPHFAALPRH
jgi:methylthioribose-1-phosphate isomerase